MTGYLSPEGKFYGCSPYEHLSIAGRLIKEKGYRPTQYEFPEDTLLFEGWIVIRSHDLFKRARNRDGRILFITEEQNNFFLNHVLDFNDEQMCDILDILKDFGNVKQLLKKINDSDYKGNGD